MNIKTIQTAGFKPAIIAMRNPMNSWGKGDTVFDTLDTHIGEKDKELSIKLQKAGPEHCKHLRMIQVWADITAPLTWWKQFDCYRMGVEKVSTSTMHKLMSRELTLDDFEAANFDCYGGHLMATVEYLNELIRKYNATEDRDEKRALWEYAIQILPQSYLQKRTVMMSYAALRNIYRQREGHKLYDWEYFRRWVESLPESWMITE